MSTYLNGTCKIPKWKIRTSNLTQANFRLAPIFKRLLITNDFNGLNRPVYGLIINNQQSITYLTKGKTKKRLD